MWLAAFLFCPMLFYLKWIYPAMMYAGFVATGFLIGTRGGMHYQGDIDAFDAFLSRHQELGRTDLLWPIDYQQLSGKQRFIKAEVAEKLFYQHDKAE